METSRTAINPPKVRVSRSVASTGGVAGRSSAMDAGLPGRRAGKAWEASSPGNGRRVAGPVLSPRLLLSGIFRNIAREGVGERADDGAQAAQQKGPSPFPACDPHRASPPCVGCLLAQCAGGLTIPPDWGRVGAGTGSCERLARALSEVADKPTGRTRHAQPGTTDAL